ncbi:MAG: hypothetical protein BWK80_58150 [Desulfobacteraceae bacterium IS3]|nr:MAG: hypothetical protein BWK80_58150 [Desulfobacteraceae bacterium IS3]
MIKKSVCFIIMSLFLGCASPGVHPPSSQVPDSGPPAFMKDYITPPKERKLIAIAGFQNKSTYSADKLWDTSAQMLTSHILDMGYFRVTEWDKIKQLFDWRDLSSMNVVNSPEKRNKMRKILLCEYFLTGAITAFDVSQRSSMSAIYKFKLFETTIRVDLSLQDAVTGEYLSAGTGEWTETQEFAEGKLGTWEPKVADKALDYAIRKALLNLTEKYDKFFREQG